MSNRRRLYVDIASIRWAPNFDEFRRHSHVPFPYHFADRKIHVVSTYFFDGISLVEISTFFPRTFFNVISLVEKSTLFPSSFFNVIFMVEKSMSCARTFIRRNFDGAESRCRFRLSCKLMKTLRSNSFASNFKNLTFAILFSLNFSSKFS